MAVSDLLDGPIANEAHGTALLELAFAVSAVDGHLADEEQAAFRELVSRVRGKTATDDDVGELLEQFVYSAHTVGLDERVRRVLPSIPAELRETAFSVAFGLSLVDREENEYEGELLEDVAKALGIDDARANVLRDDVRRKLSIGG